MSLTNNTRRQTVLMIVPVLLGARCATAQVTAPPPPAPAQTPPTPVKAPPARSSNADRPVHAPSGEFTSAILFKPRDEPDLKWLTDLAPLVVEQVPDKTPSTTKKGFFGALVLDDRNALVLDPAQPTLIVDMREVEHGGLTYRQLSFGWVYTWSKTSANTRSICMTLAPDGFPCVWEVGGPQNTGTRRFYLSRSFEAKCVEQFGPPLPDRQNAAEQAKTDTPHTVIAGLVEDGPIPMGPYVYLQNDTHTIKAITCRCSPALVETIIDSRDYELKPRFSGGFEWRSVEPQKWRWTEPWDVLRWPYGREVEKPPSPSDDHED